MKKYYLSALFIGGLALINAQSGFGVKAGVNLANLIGEDVENADMKLGFNVGLTYEYEISDKFHIQPELLYSLQGTKIKESESNEEYAYDSELIINLGYINIPVMFQYLPNDRFFLEAGPQIGFNIDAKADFKLVKMESNITESEDGSQDIKDMVNTVDFGLGIGLGYEFVENIGVSTRYVLGLNSVFEDSGEDIKVHNSVLQIGAFYKF